jgi:hypothetical protein
MFPGRRGFDNEQGTYHNFDFASDVDIDAARFGWWHHSLFVSSRTCR